MKRDYLKKTIVMEMATKQNGNEKHIIIIITIIIIYISHIAYRQYIVIIVVVSEAV